MDLYCYEEEFPDISTGIPAEALMDMDDNNLDNLEQHQLATLHLVRSNVSDEESEPILYCDEVIQRVAVAIEEHEEVEEDHDEEDGVPAELLMCDEHEESISDNADAHDNNNPCTDAYQPSTAAASFSESISACRNNRQAKAKQRSSMNIKVRSVLRKRPSPIYDHSPPVKYNSSDNRPKRIQDHEWLVERAKMLRYYSETSTMLSRYERRKELLKRQKRLDAAKERVKEAKKRFLSGFFNERFDGRKSSSNTKQQKSLHKNPPKMKKIDHRKHILEMISRRVANSHHVYEQYKNVTTRNKYTSLRRSHSVDNLGGEAVSSDEDEDEDETTVVENPLGS